MRPLLRLAFPLSRTYSSRGSTTPYKTEATHSGINLAETTPSHRLDQSLILTDTSVPHWVFNEKMERLSLKSIRGGDVDLLKDEETGIARVVISNPDRANAMTGSMMVDLSDIVSELESWQGGKGLVLHGDLNSPHFCAGADVELVRALDGPQAGAMMCLYMQNTMSRLQRLPLLSVALVTGQAIGGGAELITACDFRLMTENAKLMFKQAKLGVSPGWGGGTRLVRLVGPQRALRLLAGVETILPKDAVDMGLVDDVIPQGADDIVGSALDWLQTYTRAPTQVVHATKKLVQAASELPIDKALKREREVFTGLWSGPAHRKMLEKLSSDLNKK